MTTATAELIPFLITIRVCRKIHRWTRFGTDAKAATESAQQAANREFPQRNPVVMSCEVTEVPA